MLEQHKMKTLEGSEGKRRREMKRWVRLDRLTVETDK